MQCPRDQADAAKHTGMSPSAGEGARMRASVNHSEAPSVFGRSSLAIRFRSLAIRFWGGHPATQEVRYEHRGDF
jgi:hypothetical protein